VAKRACITLEVGVEWTGIILGTTDNHKYVFISAKIKVKPYTLVNIYNQMLFLKQWNFYSSIWMLKKRERQLRRYIVLTFYYKKWLGIIV
jgi:hypothetical protein